VSWSELLPSGPCLPPAPPLRHLILGALAEAFVTRRNMIGYCADCDPGRPCPDHAQDLDDADAYEAAYMRIRGIGSDGAMLTLTGGLT
jgi:hypothetical protein